MFRSAPKIFPILWKLAQPIISEESKKKIKVLGKNYKEELLKYVAEDQLPAFLGGTMTGPGNDPLCSHKVSKNFHCANIRTGILVKG